MLETPPARSLLSAATAQALELPSLLRVVSHLAASGLGRDRILALEPCTDLDVLLDRRRRFAETSRLLVHGTLVPDFDVHFGVLLERVTTGRPAIEGIDLMRLADLIRTNRKASERIDEAEPPCPGLAALSNALPDLQKLVRKLESTLDRRGEVREDASPKLAALRRQIRQVRDDIYRDLGDYMQGNKESLAEDTIPMRGGRLVLMVQASTRTRNTGLVHGRSGTGKSLYFEPLHVVESNNNLQQSVEDEEAERRRILAELIAEVRAALPALALHVEFLGELDFLQTCVRFGDLCEGTLPEIAPRHQLRLVAARHPLLDPRLAELREEALGQPGHQNPIVPLELELSAERRILVVTGPNAGGKTVSLKTTGLLAAAAQCGLPIPAAPGSRLPFLARLVATVGDEQDLLSDRSTFSGRLLRLREAWELAGPDSLILLDELGSGTDPQEGSALSVALLEELIGMESLGVITTHLTQVALVALEAPGASCAAMEFNGESGRPTFRLVPGPPGGSEALALARRLGLPARWLERAEARLGTEHRDLRMMIAEVDRLRRELIESEERLAEEIADAEKLNRRLDAERRELEEERGKLGPKLRGELESFRRDTLQKLRQEVDRLREEFESGRRRGLEAEAVERLFAAAPELPAEEPKSFGGTLQVGGKARHAVLGWEGTIEKLEPGRAEVLVRGKRLRCDPSELVAAGSGPSAKSTKTEMRYDPKRSTDAEESAAAPGEINLIGQRVEPALEALESFVDAAVLGTRGEVRVVHGHGSGRLRQAVRDYLKAHRAVASLRAGEPNEGGNGATVVIFKGK